MSAIREEDDESWSTAPYELPPATAGDLAHLRAMERAAGLATCAVLRALMAHYGGWEHVPRARRGFFATYTADQVAEYIARVERNHSQD
jgi:hypothetical protein